MAASLVAGSTAEAAEGAEAHALGLEAGRAGPACAPEGEAEVDSP